LVAGIVARISGCASQTELSLNDQVDHAKQLVSEMYDGRVEFRSIATTGKGERLDRPELEQIRQEILKGELDLLVMEDLGRLVRGVEAVRLFGLAVDHGTRGISPNDHIDTINDTWEEDALAACRDHVAHNAHTSRRLKQKLMNRFEKFGGATARPIFGVIVPPGAKTYSDWRRDEMANPFIREGLRILKHTGNCNAVADYFNDNNVPVGSYCRRKTWDGRMIRRLYRNRLLGGIAGRGFKHTVKQHETGRRISRNNPDGPNWWPCPHLAHVDLADLDEVNAMLARDNHDLGRKPINDADPRARVPRKRTRFPGQHSRCWYCGRQHVWGGNGMSHNMMCTGAREWLCWNSIGFSGRLAAEKLVRAILTECYALEQFDTQFRQLVADAAKDAGSAIAARWEKLRRDEQALEIKSGNIQRAIAEYGPQPLIGKQLEEIAADQGRLKHERRELETLDTAKLKLPQSVAELRQLLQQHFTELAVTSAEFGILMRQLVPEFHVQLVRLCDGGHLMPRALVTLALDAIVPDAQHVPGLKQVLTRRVSIDLFTPPQRQRVREMSVKLAAEGLTSEQIAARLPEKVTATAVQNALNLQRKMESMGLTDPYIVVTQPPADYPKLRRHRNAKYRFTPLDGYEPKQP
jgi:hypothetical protein